MRAADARQSEWSSEAALAQRWAAGLPGPLRLEDGRALGVVFPGVPGGGSGPDFSGAILDAGGDLLRGDVELHLVASGWKAHRHATDVAYAGVVLHVVGRNDENAAVSAHHSGRLIPILVAPPGRPGFPPPFTPPCAISCRSGLEPAPVLQRMGLRRLRIKAARVAPVIAAHGPGQALYATLLETLGGPANREAFASLARTLPVGNLLELVEGQSPRPFALSAHLKGRSAGIVLRRAGLRPMAAPGRRLEAAGKLFARLWPEGSTPGFPDWLAAAELLVALQCAGVGRALAIECAVNAVLPVALASGQWAEEEIEATFLGLASPGTYGRLRPLEGWLGAESASGPFRSAARLQGGLLLHAEYCTRGMCGRCPLSEV